MAWVAGMRHNEGAYSGHVVDGDDNKLRNQVAQVGGLPTAGRVRILEEGAEAYAEEGAAGKLGGGGGWEYC